jgi:hypothetical protein
VSLRGELTVGFEGIHEMLGVGFGEVLHTKVVNTQNEGGVFSAMAPEAWGEGHGLVSMWS